jgi:hypothetical protein
MNHWRAQTCRDGKHAIEGRKRRRIGIRMWVVEILFFVLVLGAGVFAEITSLFLDVGDLKL